MRRPWTPPLYLLLPLVWLFRRAWWNGELFAYRDAAHYYFPLYRYVQQQWLHGLPLWNPLDGIGQPLWGDPTAAVCYPGQLLFALPLPYSQCFVLYIVAHLWLGGYGAFQLARSHCAGWHAAIMAGLAYELSGHILFQYCNPIYCVGAAWLPWALLTLLRTLRGRRSAGLLCLTLSMLVLGGDPHTAYYVLLLGLLFAVLANNHPTTRRQLLNKLLKLSLIAVAVASLSAVQVLPTYEWIQRSDRSLRDGPRSVWELMADTATFIRQRGDPPQLKHLVLRPPEDSHDDRVDDFSVGPWRWLELVWPNLSGAPFPTHQRWLSAFPGEARTWTPSLYLGLLPILLALWRFRLRSGSLLTRWYSWTALLSALAAFGTYGAGWLIDEIRYQWQPEGFEKSQLLPGLGGLYWWLNMLLPAHVGFRYPAKLWTLTTLALCLLGAKGWPLLKQRHSIVLWSLAVFSAISLLGAAVATSSLVVAGLVDVPPHPIFGPLDVAATQRGLIITFLHASLVGGGILLAIRSCSGSLLRWTLTCLTALEVTWAHAGLIQTVPRASPSYLSFAAGDVLYRTSPALTYPQAWERQSSPHRFHHLQQHDVATLMPKHHLRLGVRALRSSVSMTCADYAVFMEVARAFGLGTSSGDQIPRGECLDLLGATHLLVPGEGRFSLPQQEVAPLLQTRMRLFQNPHAFPRAWLVHDWQTLPAVRAIGHKRLRRRTHEIMFADGAFRDFRRFAMVESAAAIPAPVAGDGRGGRCTIERARGAGVAVQVETAAPAILVLADQFYPGWQAWVAAENGPPSRRAVLRVNRVMRGVHLEAGRYRIVFRYRPRSVYLGIAISAGAWAALLVLLLLPAAKLRAQRSC